MGVAEDKVKALLDEMVDQYRCELAGLIEDCESPIEQLLALWVHRFAQRYELPGFYMYAQAEDVVPPYRLDFMVAAMDPHHNEIAEVVVECDGHDFHEKTKAQAARDKKRDRAIAGAGYHTLRFTGSEIWHNPKECAREIVRFLRVELIRSARATGDDKK